jgi:uncharacterized protein YecT (DUF1311 family)
MIKKIIFALSLVLSQAALAASFDCTQAKSPSEIAICSDESLSKLDEQLAAAYSSLKSKLSDSAQLEADQKGWLSNRESCGNQVDCLASNIQARIGELTQQESALTSTSTTPTKPAKSKDESNWFVGLLVWVALLAGIAWVVLKIIRFYKNMKFRGMVKKNYESITQIGSFVDSSKFVTAHGASVGKKSSRAEVIEYIPARLHISRPSTSNTGTWTALIGHFDSGSYSNAMMHYQTAYQQWKIGKAQFDQQETQARKRAEQMKQAYISSYYNVSSPSKPSKNDFITYTPQSGECSANLQHGYIVTSGNTEFPSEKCGSFVIDIDKIQNNITSIYKALLDRIYSGQLSVNIDAEAMGFYNLDEQRTYDKLSKEIGNALVADAKRYMGEYYKDLSVPSFNGHTQRNEIEFPVAIVVAKMPDGKINYTIHDHLFPEIVLT